MLSAGLFVGAVFGCVDAIHSCISVLGLQAGSWKVAKDCRLCANRATWIGVDETDSGMQQELTVSELVCESWVYDIAPLYG